MRPPNAPRNVYEGQKIKYICVDALLVFSLSVLTGHMILNTLEGHMVQKEVTNMKSKLYSLSDTLTNIKQHYDNYQVEVKDIIKIVESNHRLKIPKPFLIEDNRTKRVIEATQNIVKPL